MPSPSLFTFGNGSAIDPRGLLSSIGEVVYSWEIQGDALSWGPNAATVLGRLPEKAMKRGIGFAALVEPGSGPSRYDAIFGSSEQTTSALRPKLTVTYKPPVITKAPTQSDRRVQPLDRLLRVSLAQRQPTAGAQRGGPYAVRCSGHLEQLVQPPAPLGRVVSPNPELGEPAGDP